MTLYDDPRIELVEKALGFELYPWQMSYIQTEKFRQGGFTTAKCLRMLLVDDGLSRDHVREIKISAKMKERFEQEMLLEIMGKLKAAGIECNTFRLRRY